MLQSSVNLKDKSKKHLISKTKAKAIYVYFIFQFYNASAPFNGTHGA